LAEIGYDQRLEKTGGGMPVDLEDAIQIVALFQEDEMKKLGEYWAQRPEIVPIQTMKESMRDEL